MTKKQELLEHLRVWHPHLWFAKASTFKDLGKIHANVHYHAHANAHYRYWVNHYHVGRNSGPDDRPPGWYTGADAVAKKQSEGRVSR